MTVDQCMAPENIHTHQSQKKIGNSEGMGGGGGGGAVVALKSQHFERKVRS